MTDTSVASERQSVDAASPLCENDPLCRCDAMLDGRLLCEVCVYPAMAVEEGEMDACQSREWRRPLRQWHHMSLKGYKCEAFRVDSRYTHRQAMLEQTKPSVHERL